MFKAGHVLEGAFANQKAAEFFPAISANFWKSSKKGDIIRGELSKFRVGGKRPALF